MNAGRADPDPYAPVAAAARLPVLDVLRGFALLGIALMNVEFFTRPLQGMSLGMDPSLYGVDRSAAWVITALVQGKFWTLFSLLFGAGFALMLARADRRRADPGFHRIYLRRLGVLLAFGLMHALLLWAGDILVPYALTGFALLLVARNLEIAMLWRIGLLLYAVPVLLLWASVALHAIAGAIPGAGTELTQAFTSAGDTLRRDYVVADAVYRSGDYTAVVRQRLTDSLDQWRLLPLLLPAILGVFLLGTWSVRSGLLDDPARRRAGWRRMGAYGVPIGVPMVIAAMICLAGEDPTVPTPRVGVGTTLMHLGSLVLCLGWAGVLGTLGERAAVQRWLAPAGRMALSNYLLQSLLLSTLFYGYGFGLWGQISRLEQVALVGVLFVLQLVLSRVWIAQAGIGPAEWLWRTLAYGRRPVRDVG